MNIHCILLTSLWLNLDSYNGMRIYNTNGLFHNYCSQWEQSNRDRVSAVLQAPLWFGCWWGAFVTILSCSFSCLVHQQKKIPSWRATSPGAPYTHPTFHCSSAGALYLAFRPVRPHISLSALYTPYPHPHFTSRPVHNHLSPLALFTATRPQFSPLFVQLALVTRLGTYTRPAP